MHRALSKLSLTHKKRCTPLSHDREANRQACTDYRRDIAKVPVEDLVFVDESAPTIAMTRLYAHAKKEASNFRGCLLNLSC